MGQYDAIHKQKKVKAPSSQIKSDLQHAAVKSTPENAVSPVVHDTLNSSGQPLDSDTRAFMEPRFEHDFSQVRVHTDAEAAESAQAVNALAYTVGRDVVFGEGQYAPETSEGRELLAHELTHVVQQAHKTGASVSSIQLGDANTPQEHQAASFGHLALSTDPQAISEKVTSLETSHAVLQRQPNLPGPPPSLGQINLSIDDKGKVDITVSGPEQTPIVSKPTIGIRRDPDGKYHMLVGGKDKVVSVDQIPDMLRGALGDKGQPGTTPPSGTLHVPTCDQLGRFKTFLDYKVSQILSANLLPLTPELYDALIEICTPKLPSVPEFKLEAPPIRFGTIESTTLDHFAVDGNEVPSRFDKDLTHLADLLKIYKDAEVHIEGHTDSTYTAEYNQGLSERRAHSVEKALRDRGVGTPFIVEGFGEERLLFPKEQNEEEKARNRRVEVWFYTPPAQKIGDELQLHPESITTP
jgi:outer membrane protein OmpA-like peptidoglycan-associated protein